MTKLTTAQAEALTKIYADGTAAQWVRNVDNRSGEALVARKLAIRRNLHFGHCPLWAYRLTSKGKAAALWVAQAN